MPYHLEGRLLEVCTCGAQCPCQPTGRPDSGACEAMNAWHIDRGAIDGVDVADLTLVALSHVYGHVLDGRPVVFYVDDRATALQQEALLSVWTGKLGGPVADLAQLMGELAGVERSAIAFEVSAGKGSLKVGHVVDAMLVAPSPDRTGQSMVPHDDVCTTIPGSETHVAEAATYRVDSPTYGFDLDLRDYEVLQGRFSFEG